MNIKDMKKGMKLTAKPGFPYGFSFRSNPLTENKVVTVTEEYQSNSEIVRIIDEEEDKAYISESEGHFFEPYTDPEKLKFSDLYVGMKVLVTSAPLVFENAFSEGLFNEVQEIVEDSTMVFSCPLEAIEKHTVTDRKSIFCSLLPVTRT